jgi:hypothetical protein
LIRSFSWIPIVMHERVNRLPPAIPISSKATNMRESNMRGYR